MAFEVHLSEMNLGETFLLMNQTDSAAFYLAKCEDFFRSIGNISALYYLDTQLIELALKQNNLALARKRLAEAVKPDYVEPIYSIITRKREIIRKLIIISGKTSALTTPPVMNASRCVPPKST